MQMIAIADKALLNEDSDMVKKLFCEAQKSGGKAFSVIKLDDGMIPTLEDGKGMYVLESCVYCSIMLDDILEQLLHKPFGTSVKLVLWSNEETALGSVTNGKDRSYMYRFGDSSGVTRLKDVLLSELNHYFLENEIPLNDIKLVYASNDDFLFTEYQRVDEYSIEAMKSLVLSYGKDNILNLKYERCPCCLRTLENGVIVFTEIRIDNDELVFTGIVENGSCLEFDVYDLAPRDLIAYIAEHVNTFCI
ncbi:hypothetical protein [Parabacteroides merdae]|uniref:hypothetical protein n=1 Tax=Parabacteroides merdae TaxID=46503 RepID=UPI0034A389BC